MIAEHFSGPRGWQVWGTLGAVFGSLLLLVVFDQMALETKWIAFALAGLFWGVITVLSGSIKKPIFVLFVIGLQIYAALYLGDDDAYLKKSVGQSGPGGFVIYFVSIPAFCLLVLHALERVVKNGLRPIVWGKAIGYPALLLMLTTGMTVLYSPERWRVIFYLFELAQFYIVFLAVVNLVASRRDVDRVIRLLMVILCMQCLVYYAQTALGLTFTLTGEVIKSDGWLGRHGGTVATRPAPFASFIMPLLHIAISRYFIVSSRGTRFWMGLLAAMGGVALVLTFTRAAWAGFTLGFVWLIVLGLRRRLIRLRRLGFLVVVLLLVVAVMLPQISGRMAADHESDYDERFRLIEMSWYVIRDNLIFGVGAGAYNFVFRDYLPPELREKGVWVYIVHNVYLLRWAETGFLGLLSLVLFYVAGFRQALAGTRLRDENLAALSLGCSAGIVSLAWEMMWDVTLGFSASALVWFLFGLLFVVRQIGFAAPLVYAPAPEWPESSPNSQANMQGDTRWSITR